MNDQRPVKRQPSLLERAADMFGLDPAKNASTIDVSKLPPEPEKRARKAKAEPVAEILPPDVAPEPAIDVTPAVEPASAKPSPRKHVAKAAPAIQPARHARIDRDRLAARGMVVPGAPVTGIAEEYRIVKREIIRNFAGTANRPVVPRGHRVLIASANPELETVTVPAEQPGEECWRQRDHASQAAWPGDRWESTLAVCSARKAS